MVFTETNETINGPWDMIPRESTMTHVRTKAPNGDVIVPEADELLAAKTPLSFWRKKRDLTQTALADAAGVPQAYCPRSRAARSRAPPRR